MKNAIKKIFIVACAICMSASAMLFTGCSDEALRSGEGANINSLAVRDLKRGTYMSLQMYKDFYNEKGEFAHRNIPKNNESDMSDCWRYTGLFSMIIRCNELNDQKYTKQFDHVVQGFEYYKGRRNGQRDEFPYAEEGTAGDRYYDVFAVNRGTKMGNAWVGGQDSVFDDQIWIAREYLNAYSVYNNPYYLKVADDLCNYIFRSGWTPDVGGITWGQSYVTRHSCSNAPFVKVLIQLAEATEQAGGEGAAEKAAEYKEWAGMVYDWTYKTLRDPSDNLYYDLIGTNTDNVTGIRSDDSIDTMKYTYNSGAMISAGVAMYNLTKEQHYLDEAAATAESCYKYFGVHDFIEGYTMYPVDTTTWFNLVMYIGYYDLYLADETAATSVYLDDLQGTIDYAYENFGHDGYIPVSWLVGWEPGWSKSDCKNLLDHTSHAETYLLLSQYQTTKADRASKAVED